MTTEIWAMGLAIFSALVGSFGPVYLKRGMSRFRFKIGSLIKNYALMAGFTAYIIGIVVFMFALKGGELSVLYPLVATTYIWVSLLSVKMLGEKMNRKKWIGMAIIMLGVVLIGGGF
jgi:uncharacterized membrane protein